MRLDWTDDSEDLTVFIRLHPRDEAERKLIIEVLNTTMSGPDSEPIPATLYAEDGRFVYGVADPDQNGAVMTRKDKRGQVHHPLFELRAFERDEEER